MMATNDQDFPSFEFETWSRLASEDPTSFEEARRLMLDSLIAAAPEPIQPRLRGLQWQVDRLRELNPPLGACLKITNLMWETVLGENGLVDNMERLTKLPPDKERPRSSGTVINFTPRT